MREVLSGTDQSQIPGTDRLLQAGISAARAGEHARARNLLLRTVAQDEANATAWLWLSQVLHSPGGQKACAEKALTLDPGDSEARKLLASARKTLADDLLRKGIAAARLGQRERACTLLRRAIQEDDKNPSAWLWLSKAVTSPSERKTYRKKANALKSRLQATHRKPIQASQHGKPHTSPYREPGTVTRAQLPAVTADRHGLVGALPTWFPLAFVIASMVLLLISTLMLARSVMARTVSPPPGEASASLSSQVSLPAPIPVETQIASPTPTSEPVDSATAAPTTQTTVDEQPSVAPPTADATDPAPVTEPAITYLPTRIVIPAIGVDAPIVPMGMTMEEIEGTPQPRWAVPDPPIAGWHETSSPLGVPGNVVINGHNFPQNAVFRDLYKIEPGEQVVLFSDQMPFPYEVTDVILLPEANQPLEVQQANASYIQPTDDERTTLVTCHPYGSIRYRLIVIAHRMELAQADE
jgi:sortase A